MAATTGERLTVSVPEAAAMLGISKSHYYELFNRGELPGRRIGHRVVVPIVKLEAFLGTDTCRPRAGAP